MPDPVMLTVEDLVRIAQKHTSMHPGIREAIRKDVREGETVHAAAKKFNVSYKTALNATWDIPRIHGNCGIRGPTLKMLQTLLKQGYFIPDPKKMENVSLYYRTLRKYFDIKRATNRNITIYFIEGREKDAFNAFVENSKVKRIGYQKLCSIMSTFGIKVSPNEKRGMLIGRMKKRVMRTVAKRIPHQASVSDFLGRFLHSELLCSTALLLK